MIIKRAGRALFTIEMGAGNVYTWFNMIEKRVLERFGGYMSKLAIFFAPGYEEIEALTVVDLCRRAGLEISMVSVDGSDKVTGSHGIEVTMDTTIDALDFDAPDCLVLPGGMPGTKNLEACEKLMAQIDAFAAAGKYIAAICAAPSIFGHRGLLAGKKACSYPNFESHLEGAEVTAGPVSIDGNIITSRGMGTAIDFGLALVGLFCGQQKADELSAGIVYR